MSNIPLLDIPAAIIAKYEGDKKVALKGTVLPVPANQVVNRYLKEIANICRIDKYLTTHVPSHLRHHQPVARRQTEECLQNARPQQRPHDRALRPCPRHQHPPRNGRGPSRNEFRETCWQYRVIGILQSVDLNLLDRCIVQTDIIYRNTKPPTLAWLEEKNTLNFYTDYLL